MQIEAKWPEKKAERNKKKFAWRHWCEFQDILTVTGMSPALGGANGEERQQHLLPDSWRPTQLTKRDRYPLRLENSASKTCVSGDSDQKKGRLRAKPNKFAGSLRHISWTRKKGTEIAREHFETKTNHLKKNKIHVRAYAPAGVPSEISHAKLTSIECKMGVFVYL